MSSSSEKEEAISYPAWHSALAGGVAGLGSRMATAPLDLIRIRRQLNQTQYPSESVVQSWMNIVKNEGGVTALYRGNMAAIYLWVGYAAVQFSVYNHSKEMLQNVCEKPTVVAFTAGALAGACATLATYPFDVCRTTFVARAAVPQPQSMLYTVASAPLAPPVFSEKTTLPFHSLVEPQPFQLSTAISSKVEHVPSTNNGTIPAAPRTFAEFTRHLYQSKGIRGFYAGAFPAVIQIIPYMGMNFAIYDFLTSKERSVGLSAYAGSISGAISKIIVYPMDTVKRRLQAEAFFGEKQYTGMLDCIITIQREEGWTSFYRGMVPSVLKTAISSSLVFALFRFTKNVLEELHCCQNPSEYTRLDEEKLASSTR
jgi:hypothetical protein